jgi:hypothetical protein
MTLIGIALCGFLLIALVRAKADRIRELFAVPVVFLFLDTTRLMHLAWTEAPSIVDGDPNCQHDWMQWVDGRFCAKCHRYEDYTYPGMAPDVR